MNITNLSLDPAKTSTTKEAKKVTTATTNTSTPTSRVERAEASKVENLGYALKIILKKYSLLSHAAQLFTTNYQDHI